MRASLLLLVVGSLSLPQVAAAHGRFPATARIAFHPTDSDIIVVQATFGLLRSDDGGGRFEWICPTVIGMRLVEDPPIFLTDDGSIQAPLFDGLSRGTDDGCTWAFPSADLTEQVVIDGVRHPTNPQEAFVVTSNGLDANKVYRSTDNGATWNPTSPDISNILFETIRVAPSDPLRIYLSGAFPPTVNSPRRPFVFRSEDGGANWEEFTFELLEGEHRGRYQWARLNTNNPNRTAVEIAERELSAICRAVGVHTPRDSNELHNKPLEIRVKVKPHYQNPGEFTNEVVGFR
ncbi:MAG: DUF669 domain-containing protein, partial [Myxococcota bacterium]